MKFGWMSLPVKRSSSSYQNWNFEKNWMSFPVVQSGSWAISLINKLKKTKLLNCTMKKFMCFVAVQPARINIATYNLQLCWKQEAQSSTWTYQSRNRVVQTASPWSGFFGSKNNAEFWEIQKLRKIGKIINRVNSLKSWIPLVIVWNFKFSQNQPHHEKNRAWKWKLVFNISWMQFLEGCYRGQCYNLNLLTLHHIWVRWALFR